MSDKSIEVDLTKITETKEHYLAVLDLLKELPRVAFDKSKMSKADLIILQHVLEEVIDNFIFSHKQTFSEHDILTFLNPKLVDIIVKDSELDKVASVVDEKESVHKETIRPTKGLNRALNRITDIANANKSSEKLKYYEVKNSPQLLDALEVNLSLGNPQTAIEESFQNILGKKVKIPGATLSDYRDAYAYAQDTGKEFKDVLFNEKVKEYRRYRSKMGYANKYNKSKKRIELVD